ncbi:MAG TPA: VOC family protein [Acetobacteraceae bacterium]|nr:VOC family protein [Acetobacteraceae bacterium]
MPSYSFEHIHLRSPDPEATAQWYERMFGAKVIRSVVQGAPRVDLDLCGQTVFIAEIKEAGTGAPPSAPYQGLEHIGLRVDDIEAAVAELKAKGVRFTLEPTELRPGLRIAFLRGPENVSIELLQRA